MWKTFANAKDSRDGIDNTMKYTPKTASVLGKKDTQKKKKKKTVTKTRYKTQINRYGTF